MSFPAWVLKFREAKTEIKFVKGGYYKYTIEYKYNPDKKRTDKVTLALLGKITEQDGFIPSDKNQLRFNKISDGNGIDIKNYGLFRLFSTLLKDEFESLKKVFAPDICELLFSFAMFRWGYNTPIKRAPVYYNHNFCSQVFSVKSASDKLFSDVLKQVGGQRNKVVDWMKSQLGMENAKEAEFVLMDSTHVHSNSDLLSMNAKGYNPDFDFDRQVRLMYLFSTKMQKPVYYRLINGNITDLNSMSLCVEEMKIENVIYIADKGFYSKENTKMMKEQGLQYIIPLKRDNQLIDYQIFRKDDFAQKLFYFIYQHRMIWYYRYDVEGENLITFLDEGLRAKEEADYVKRIETLPESFTKEKFLEKLPSFGSLTFTYNIKTEKSCEEIYQAYKQRNEIETIFDAYKNILKADIMYMQNRYVLEGWLLANFIAMIAYHKLYMSLREIKKLNKYSPKDIIELSKSICKLKINNEWKRSEVSKKDLALFKQLKIDYLT